MQPKKRLLTGGPYSRWCPPALRCFKLVAIYTQLAIEILFLHVFTYRKIYFINLDNCGVPPSSQVDESKRPNVLSFLIYHNLIMSRFEAAIAFQEKNTAGTYPAQTCVSIWKSATRVWRLEAAVLQKSGPKETGFNLFGGEIEWVDSPVSRVSGLGLVDKKGSGWLTVPCLEKYTPKPKKNKTWWCVQ